MPVSDPNWLLSTTAQCAAALVAIVGGFLVSRVVALSTERQGLARRWQELVGRRAISEGQRAAVDGEITGYAYDLFFKWTMPRSVEARGQNVDTEDLLEQCWPRGATEEQIRAWATSIAALVAQARDEVTRRLEGGRAAVTTLYEHGLERGEYPTELLEEILKDVKAQAREKLSAFDRSIIGPDLDLSSLANIRGFASSDLPIQRNDANIIRRADLQASIDALDAEILIVDEQLRRLARPREVDVGVYVLAYFAGVSIVLPLALLAKRPVPASNGTRIVVVSLFVSGLVALLGYIVWAVRRLQR